MDETRSVLTQHNDRARSGSYLQETILTPATVRSSTFGRLCSRKVDGTMSAQPLYGAGVAIGGVTKNVLYVVTRMNKVYAFDADNLEPNPQSGLLWQRELTDCNGLTAAPLPGMDDGPHPCRETHGPVGITATPVIDAKAQTMYLVFRTGLPPDNDPAHQNATDYIVESHHWIAALDIASGKNVRAPVEIAFSYRNSAGTLVEFDPNMQLNRPGLLLLDGVLYIAFGSPVCDSGGNPYQGTNEKAPPMDGFSRTVSQIFVCSMRLTQLNSPGSAVFGNRVTGYLLVHRTTYSRSRETTVLPSIQMRITEWISGFSRMIQVM